MELFLLQLFIFFAASAIAVPLAKKLGLGSVLGYLIAGIVIGPFGLSLISDVESVMHFTEFGVVMMLFLVGLELKPSMLWKMRVPIIGMGGAQVLVTAAAIGAVSFYFLKWQEAVAIGLILALSSTAIVVQSLKERGLMATASGRSIFSVLLFQDLAVIPILAFLPLLATGGHHEGEHAHGALMDISSLPQSMQFVVTILAVLAIFFIGKYVSRPVFRAIADTHVREIFVAAALAMVVGISLLMTIVGLSPALGTFLAGVVLADSEYRHELESDIEPFKGLLLGIFFISIGASLNFILIAKEWVFISGITIGLILIKFLVLFIIGMVFKMARRDKLFFAITLAQGGEFAFVLFQFALGQGILSASVVEPFISAVAITMFLAPLLFKLFEVLFDTKGKEEESSGEMDTIEQHDSKVILAGFGQLGTDIGRFLLSAGVKPVILDHDAAKVDLLRKLGFEVYYGDVMRLDLLESAGASEAELLILTMEDLDISKKLIELVHKHYPQLKIVANASDMSSTYELMDLGVHQVRKQSFGTAILMGQDILKLLGMDPYDAYRLSRIFRKHNDEMIDELFMNFKDGLDGYITAYQQQMSNLEKQMSLDMRMEPDELEKAWTAMSPDK